MDLRARNRIATLRCPVTARLAVSDSGTSSWIWVLPTPDGRIRVARIVVPKELAESGGFFAEDDYETAEVVYVGSVDDVDDAVRNLGGDPDLLDSPWRNDFPL